MPSGPRTIRLVDAGLSLALHWLPGTGAGQEGARPLLVLPGAGEASPRVRPSYATEWRGPVFGLDFPGQGDSPCPVGGGYNAEGLTACASAALNHLGSATVVGLGLGAYVAVQALDATGAVIGASRAKRA